MPLAPGELRAAKYRIELETGRGSFGRFYRAHDMALDCVVAIKELHKSQDDLGSSAANDYVRRSRRKAQV